MDIHGINRGEGLLVNQTIFIYTVDWIHQDERGTWGHPEKDEEQISIICVLVWVNNLWKLVMPIKIQFDSRNSWIKILCGKSPSDIPDFRCCYPSFNEYHSSDWVAKCSRWVPLQIFKPFDWITIQRSWLTFNLLEILLDLVWAFH